MKSILFTNQKGGVGKTLLADETAFHLEKAHVVSFLDLDQQGGAIHVQHRFMSESRERIIVLTLKVTGLITANLREWLYHGDIGTRHSAPSVGIIDR